MHRFGKNCDEEFTNQVENPDRSTGSEHSASSEEEGKKQELGSQSESIDSNDDNPNKASLKKQRDRPPKLASK